MLFKRRNHYRPKPATPRSNVIALRIVIILAIVLILVGGLLLGPGNWHRIYYP